MHSHILCLQGNSPDGRSWSAVASPYWPKLAEAWARVRAFLFVSESSERSAPLHLLGFAAMPSCKPVDAVLSDMDFRPPRGGENSNTALTVSAGIQPTGRKMPQIIL